MGQSLQVRLEALMARLGLPKQALPDDSCTIQVDELPIHLVGRADRWVILYCELGPLPDGADTAMLCRLLNGNLHPTDGPISVLAFDPATQNVLLWCQVDLHAHDDGEWCDRFEQFVLDSEQAQAWLKRGCVTESALSGGGGGSSGGAWDARARFIGAQRDGLRNKR